MAQKISKSFSKIGENIKLIRQVKKISQAEFAAVFNLARPSVGAYEEGRSEPKIETLIAIAKHFRISIDALLTKKLTVSEIYSFDRLNKKLDAVHSKESGGEKNEKVPLITAEKFIEYTIHHNNSNWILDCPQVGIPVNIPGIFRVFEMAGLEMSVQAQGIKNGDLLVCRKIEDKILKSQIGKVVLLVADGIHCRRLEKVDSGTLWLNADNTSFSQIELKRKSIEEAWSVVGSFTTTLDPPERIDERLAKIEEKLKNLDL